ncbi:MAG: N-6 DNA methylase, partial [Deltaproteobacteria bacterium]|nr:N-6 DNA methylase [Deltaproteobacteria bacterium]
MAIDLTGVDNVNEYYTNHYLATIFDENVKKEVSRWREEAKEGENTRTPWALLRTCAANFREVKDKSPSLELIKTLADGYLKALGYPAAKPLTVPIGDNIDLPVYLEATNPNGSPLLWCLLSQTDAEAKKELGKEESEDAENKGEEKKRNLLGGHIIDGGEISKTVEPGQATKILDIQNEDLITKILFRSGEVPRWLLIVNFQYIALIDRNKWGEKKFLSFDLLEMFSRGEDSALQALAVLLHKQSVCPEDGQSLLDIFGETSNRHASEVSKDLKYSLRQAIELLGNEVLYDLAGRQGRDLDNDPVDSKALSIECLRYMYRFLFVLFIEARPELGYAPLNDECYHNGYSLEFLRDVAENVRGDLTEVEDGFFLHLTLTKLFDFIYNGYPSSDDQYKKLDKMESIHHVFLLQPLKAHIFDPEYTKLISSVKLRNKVMLKIIDLMSVTRPTKRRSSSRGRISYSTLGINQLGSVYESLLSLTGFIAKENLVEVKGVKDEIDELDVGYFVPESELENYPEDERVYHEAGDRKGQLKIYEKGTFIYRLAGREREKSASYYTPESLTKCLVKYTLKHLLEGKTADQILELKICEPAMGSAAFLNETINQLAENYLLKKQEETGLVIDVEDRIDKMQRVKMYIADRNVFGIDLNPVAVELAEISLWLNSIVKGGFVPWFGTQLFKGNSLIGARRQAYDVNQLITEVKENIWFNQEPLRITPNSRRKTGIFSETTKIDNKKNTNIQVYHFLLGDPGMADYDDKVIKKHAAKEIKIITDWKKGFLKPLNKSEIKTLIRLSDCIDVLWFKQVDLQLEILKKTTDSLEIYGQREQEIAPLTSIREKDLIVEKLYESKGGDNASPYARLKMAM